MSVRSNRSGRCECAHKNRLHSLMPLAFLPGCFTNTRTLHRHSAPAARAYTTTSIHLERAKWLNDHCRSTRSPHHDDEDDSTSQDESSHHSAAQPSASKQQTTRRRRRRQRLRSTHNSGSSIRIRITHFADIRQTLQTGSSPTTTVVGRRS